MKKIKGVVKYDGRRLYMGKMRIRKELLSALIDNSTDDWNELCTNCTTLVKEAKMSNEDIDEIVERVRKENG